MVSNAKGGGAKSKELSKLVSAFQISKIRFRKQQYHAPCVINRYFLNKNIGSYLFFASSSVPHNYQMMTTLLCFIISWKTGGILQCILYTGSIASCLTNTCYSCGRVTGVCENVFYNKLTMHKNTTSGMLNVFYGYN